MELALQFENLNCEELCAIDGGNKAQDVGYRGRKVYWNYSYIYS